MFDSTTMISILATIFIFATLCFLKGSRMLLEEGSIDNTMYRQRLVYAITSVVLFGIGMVFHWMFF